MSGSSAGPGPSVDVLAAKRTHRPNPLNNFQIYDGGWNLTNLSYLASAGYTGLPGFIIGLLWIIMGFGLMILAGFMYVCCKDNLRAVADFDRFGNYTTLGFLILSTVVTIAGCGALFTGQEGLHSDLSTVFTYLMTQAVAAANASVSSVPPMAAPSAARAAEAIEKATNSTSTTIHHILDSIRVWLIILAVSMLVLSLIGLVFKPIVYTLVTIGWLLVISTWVLCGVFLLIYSVLGDTCVAMREWAANPRSGTGFDIIMNCNANSSSTSSHLSVSKLPLLVTEDELRFTEYKFHLNDIDRQNEESYLIDDPNGGDQNYDLWVKKANKVSVQQKTSSSPPAADSCAKMRASFVPIFNTISTNNCPSMCRNAKWVWISLATLSTGSMVSICLWILFTRRSTIRLRKLEIPGNPLPFDAYAFQEFQTAEKKNDYGHNYGHDDGASSLHMEAYSTGYPTPNTELSLGGRRRKPHDETFVTRI